MFLSVIIPTLNRSSLLERALESLRFQTYPQKEYEIIIIDNGSTDDTKNICDKYDKVFLNFKYIYDSRPGLHTGRHQGLINAQGDILVYGDDDIRALPTWLEGISESFMHKDVVLVGGKNIPEYEILPPAWEKKLWHECEWGKANSYYSLLDFGEHIKEISPLYIWGCNFSIRKKYLTDIGGFHPDGMPWKDIIYRGDGETAVSEAILNDGLKAIYNPKASVYHYVPKTRLTYQYIYKRSFSQGVSDSYTVIRKNDGLLNKFEYFKHCVLLYLKLIKGLIKVIINKAHHIELQIRKGYLDGFIFHQKEVRHNDSLLEWVLKNNYLEEQH